MFWYLLRSAIPCRADMRKLNDAGLFARSNRRNDLGSVFIDWSRSLGCSYYLQVGRFWSLGPRREASERRHCLQPWLDVAQIDLRLQEGDLVFDCIPANIDVP